MLWNTYMCVPYFTPYWYFVPVLFESSLSSHMHIKHIIHSIPVVIGQEDQYESLLLVPSEIKFCYAYRPTKVFLCARRVIFVKMFTLLYLSLIHIFSFKPIWFHRFFYITTSCSFLYWAFILRFWYFTTGFKI